MGDQYVRDIAGGAKRVKDDHDLKVAQEAGLPSLSREQAQSEYAREIAKQRAHEELGTAGEAVLGGISGLTLGLSPAVGAGIADYIDPEAHARERLAGASDTGTYKAADFAGMVIPAFFSGGESLAAREGLQGAERGVIGRALSGAPAGMLGRAGSQAERAITSFLPEASGVMGKAASDAMKYAARGSAEGAIVSLGHTIGDDVIHDKPLSAQALAASGLEGALFGGLVGGVTGGVSSVAGSGFDAIAGKTGASGERGMGQMARRFGLSTEDVAAQRAAPGGQEQVMRDWHEALERGGANFKSSMPEMEAVASKNIADFQATKGDIVGTLTKEAPMATPSVARVEGRLQDEVLSQLRGSIGERQANKIADSLLKDLRGLENPSYEINVPGAEPVKPVKPVKPVWDTQSPYGKTPGSAFYTKYNADMAAYDEAMTKYGSEMKAYKASSTGEPAVVSKEPGSWQKWIESRDQVALKASSVVGKGLEGELKASIYKGVLNIMDDEIRTSMEAAAEQIGNPSLAASFNAAEAGIRVNKAMAAAVAHKAASRIVGSSPHLGPNDGNTLAWGTLTGHPLGGAAIVAMRGVARIVKNRLEPHMAEAAYNMSMGARAAGAVASVKESVSKATNKFFDKSSVARGAVIAKSRPDSSPKGFQSAIDSLQELTSQQHQQRMNEYANKLHEIGQEELAQEILATNQRAKDYLMFNAPPNPKHQKAGSLRAMPKAMSLDSKQFRFMTIHSAITKPVETIVAGLEDGSLNKTQVNAIKYVYPNIIEATADMVHSKILETKAEGKFMPADKIATIGVLLGAAVDSTLEKGFIAAVQAAHDANSAPPPSPENGGQSSAKTVTAQSEFSTPLQSAIT